MFQRLRRRPIKTPIVHEMAHFFGLDDEDL